ncbi:MAG TPA: ComEA family DNA-binding protein [Candidatus Saccharimonadales bacterium]|nr:ComEA family DNA-binding protein [Candidatus Saccharimonadales bacterium]
MQNFDLKSLFEKYSPLVRRHWLPITAAGLGMICLVYGLIVFFGASGSASDVRFESANASSATSSASMGKQVIVDVEGAVTKPGVYHVSGDARVKDALIAAGGLSQNADRGWVAKNLNLATKVIDGGKIYIPAAGDSSAGSVVSQTTTTSDSGTTAVLGTTTGMVNINSASEQDLDNLPGVGPVTAAKIINGRPYQTIDELTMRKIVSKSVFAKIKDKITAF